MRIDPQHCYGSGFVQVLPFESVPSATWNTPPKPAATYTSSTAKPKPIAPKPKPVGTAASAPTVTFGKSDFDKELLRNAIASYHRPTPPPAPAERFGGASIADIEDLLRSEDAPKLAAEVRDLLTDSVLRQRFVARWWSEPAVRAEFGDKSTLDSYVRAVAEGRA